MSKPILKAVVIVALAATAAFAGACGGDDDADDPTSTPSTPASTQAVPTQPASGTPTSAAGDATAEVTPLDTSPASTTVTPGGATVQAGTAGLVDSAGFSLYIFASDVADSGQSACVGGCSSAWPPLAVEAAPTAGPGVAGVLGTITRLDGSLQVTYNGKPLYRWINDVNPGDTTGTAINNWSLAQP